MHGSRQATHKKHGGNHGKWRLRGKQRADQNGNYADDAIDQQDLAKAITLHDCRGERLHRQIAGEHREHQQAGVDGR
ncbi:hypothetical protein D9M73_269150 [compost metagenome]